MIFMVVQTLPILGKTLLDFNERCWYPVKVEKTTFKTAKLKRAGNLFDRICSIENLELADINASRGKSKQPGVIIHNRNKEENIMELHVALLNGTFKTSPYQTFTVFEPKERLIFKLPYYPDRILHHAIFIHLEKILVDTFTADTYSCIKGRGIHGGVDKIKDYLKNRKGTTYSLKLDIVKFYPSVDHDILKALLRRKIKDYRLLCLLDEIIDSASGLPIGNLLSQLFSTLYLSGLDHWLKEQKGVKYYVRYADDILVLSDDKKYLHGLLEEIREYISSKLKLSVKKNHMVSPVAICGIRMLGYWFFHDFILVSPTIKKNFCRMAVKDRNDKSIASYYGWLKHCNSINLMKKMLGNETVQRLRYKNRSKKLHRRQIAYSEDFKQKSSNS